MRKTIFSKALSVVLALALMVAYVPAGMQLTASAADTKANTSVSNTSGTVYVSQNGNDETGNGTSSAPYKTFAKATTDLVAGNKVVIIGTYDDEALTLTNVGDATGEAITIVGQDGAIVKTINIGSGCANIDISGLTISGGLTIDGDATAIAVHSNDIAGTVNLGAASNVTIDNNVLTGDIGISKTGNFTKSKIVNNTFENSTTAISAADVDSDSIIGNNIFDAAVSITGSAAVDYNLYGSAYFTAEPTDMIGDNSVYGDAKFAGVGDYQLTSGSKAIDAANATCRAFSTNIHWLYNNSVTNLYVCYIFADVHYFSGKFMSHNNRSFFSSNGVWMVNWNKDRTC